MRRRTFFHLPLGALAAAPLSAAPLSAARLSPLPPVADDGSRILFFQSSRIIERSEVEVVPPPLEKLGELIKPDSPADEFGVIAAMGCGIVQDDRGHYHLYYTGRSKQQPGSHIAVAESADALTWTKPSLGVVRISGQDTNAVLIEGVPDGADCVQPSLIRLADGRWRMYFWAHVSKPVRQGRYVCAESTDGIRWKTLNFQNPCLIHPWDINKWGWLDGPEARRTWQDSGRANQREAQAAQRIRSNDAVITYADPAGGYEMFSVWPLPNPQDSGRYVPYDNAHFMLRVVTRRTSQDGLTWSDPRFLIVPDALDSWDQQFYYLAQHRVGNLRIGFVGNYRVSDQMIDIEFVYSTDGCEWQRPLRGAWLARGSEGSSDSKMIYMPAHLIDRGDHWLALYSSTNALHNKYSTGRHVVNGVKISRWRFAGLSSVATATARIRTDTFFLGGDKLFLDANVRGRLRAELCTAFGRPLPGMTFAEAVPLTGDSPAHELRWNNSTAADYQNYGVSLRLEWTDATVYGLHSPRA